MSCDIKLKSKGLRLTPQRRLILEILHKSLNHLTAEKILEYVKARAPGVNKSTVYRTLELLEELGCVFKSELGDRFIYHHAEEGRHHHLVCRKCGESIECNEELFLPLQKSIAEKYGFQVEFKHAVMGGLCSGCKNKI